MAIKILKPLCGLNGTIAPSVSMYARVSAILKTVAKLASILKTANPHDFRRIRATHLANHLPEAQMNEYMGWMQVSEMPSTYVHLSGCDVDQALLKPKQHHHLRERGLGKRFFAEEMPEMQSRKSTGKQVLQSVRCDS
jgi:tryptophan 2,3-dioxygenase